MQSSFMNSEKLRLSALNHSEPFSFSGEAGACPTRASRSVAVDKPETADLGLRLAFASAPEDQARGRPDPSGQQKSDAERPRREGEPNDEEEQDGRAEREGNSETKSDDLPPELHGCELELEPHDRARALGNLFDRRAESLRLPAVSLGGVHGLSSRSTWRARR